MAQLTIPHICPLCNRPVEDDQPKRVCGIDQRGLPDVPPTNIWGHRACAAQMTELPILRRHA